MNQELKSQYDKLRELLTEPVVAESRGMLLPGKLIDVRVARGRVEGCVLMPKGARPPTRWFYASNISQINKNKTK